MAMYSEYVYTAESSMPKKNSKPLKAGRNAYNETKGRYNINMTPTAMTFIDELATSQGLSRSEFFERLARKLMQGIPILSEQEMQELKKLSASRSQTKTFA